MALRRIGVRQTAFLQLQTAFARFVEPREHPTKTKENEKDKYYRNPLFGNARGYDLPTGKPESRP